MDDGRLPPKVAYNTLMDEYDTASVHGTAYWHADRDTRVLMVAHQQVRKALNAMIQEDTKPIVKKGKP